LFKVLFVREKGEEGIERLKELTKGELLWEEALLNETLEEEIADKAPDMVILRTGKPRIAHEILQVVKGFRKERPLPVLIMAAGDLLDQGELLLEADDFLIIPFDPKEAILRIERALRRTYSVVGKDVIRCGDLLIDLSRREVTLGGEPLSLTFKEYELLRFLAANRGRVFSRETLLNKIWGYDYYGGERTVDVHIRRLRAKIEIGGRSFIETVRGVGYRFKEGC